MLALGFEPSDFSNLVPAQPTFVITNKSGAFLLSSLVANIIKHLEKVHIKKVRSNIILCA